MPDVLSAATEARPPRASWSPAHFGHGLAVFDLDRTLVVRHSLSHVRR